VCSYCEDVSSLSECKKPHPCLFGGKNDGCYTQTWLSVNGTRFYSKGCYNPEKKKCSHFADNCTPLRPILKCCDTVLCNAADPLKYWRPLKPQGLRVEQVDRDSVNLQWNRVCDDRYVYEIARAEVNSGKTPVFVWSHNTTAAIESWHTVISGLEKGNYSFAVRSHHENRYSEQETIRFQVGKFKGSLPFLSKPQLIVVVLSLTLVMVAIVSFVIFYMIRKQSIKKGMKYEIDRIYSVPTNPLPVEVIR